MASMRADCCCQVAQQLMFFLVADRSEEKLAHWAFCSPNKQRWRNDLGVIAMREGAGLQEDVAPGAQRSQSKKLPAA